MALTSIAGPRLVCESPKYDFGSVIGRDQIEHAFVLTNKGDEPVKISSIKNCCGVTSSVTPMEILPGSNAVCRSIFTTKNRYGKQEKQILLATNDRRKPYFELMMTGVLKRPVEVSPRIVRLEKLTAGGEIDVEIAATNLLGKSIELVSVESTVKGIQAVVVGGIDDPAIVRDIGDVAGGKQQVRPPRSQLQQFWTIRLLSNGNLTTGRLTGMIKLNFSTGIVNVPVIGTVRPPLQVIPDKISLSRSSDKPIERLIMIRSVDDTELSSVTAELVGIDGNLDVKQLSEGKWQLNANLFPSSAKANPCIRIWTSVDLQKEISVPLLLN